MRIPSNQRLCLKQEQENQTREDGQLAEKEDLEVAEVSGDLFAIARGRVLLYLKSAKRFCLQGDSERSTSDPNIRIRRVVRFAYMNCSHLEVTEVSGDLFAGARGGRGPRQGRLGGGALPEAVQDPRCCRVAPHAAAAATRPAKRGLGCHLGQLLAEESLERAVEERRLLHQRHLPHQEKSAMSRAPC